MANGIRTGDPRGFNKGHSSKFCVGSQVWQIPEEGWRTYQLKRCGNNNKDEDNSLKTLNEKNDLYPYPTNLNFFWLIRKLCFDSKLIGKSCIILLGNTLLHHISAICHFDLAYYNMIIICCFRLRFFWLIVFGFDLFYFFFFSASIIVVDHA